MQPGEGDRGEPQRPHGRWREPAAGPAALAGGCPRRRSFFEGARTGGPRRRAGGGPSPAGATTPAESLARKSRRKPLKRLKTGSEIQKAARTGGNQRSALACRLSPSTLRPGAPPAGRERAPRARPSAPPPWRGRTTCGSPCRRRPSDPRAPCRSSSCG
jgi:hypothetical protein